MTTNEETCAANKAVVVRFNRDVIERGDEAAFHAIMAAEFVNRSAPPGMPAGPEGMLYMFNQILRPAFPDLSVQIHAQVTEGDLVTTRKTIRGTHRGAVFGIEATGKAVEIDVIDIVRVKDGKYVEHWGVNTLPSVLEHLRGK